MCIRDSDKIRQESGENMLISVEHLSKRQNIKEIVNDVSFAIEDRDKIALIGVNGTGKTTLLRILAGLETYEEGTITKKSGLRVSYPVSYTHLMKKKAQRSTMNQQQTAVTGSRQLRRRWIFV